MMHQPYANGQDDDEEDARKAAIHAEMIQAEQLVESHLAILERAIRHYMIQARQAINHDRDGTALDLLNQVRHFVTWTTPYIPQELLLPPPQEEGQGLSNEGLDPMWKDAFTEIVGDNQL